MAAEDRARQLGFATLADLLIATTGMSEARLAQLLEIRPNQIANLRLRHGRPAPVAEPRRHTERDGYLLCLECGRWYRNLGIHLKVHGMDGPAYCFKNGLPPEVPLLAQPVLAAHSRSMRGSRSPQSIPVSRGRDHYEHRARRLGWPDLDSMLEKTAPLTHGELGEILGISARTVRRLREQVGVPSRARWRPRQRGRTLEDPRNQQTRSQQNRQRSDAHLP